MTINMLAWSEILFFSVPPLLLFFLYLYAHHFFRPSQTNTKNPFLPTKWPVVGMLPGWLAHFNSILDYTTRILQSTGGTFLYHGLFKPVLMTSNPGDIRHMFVDNFQNYPKGENFIEILLDTAGEGIFNTNGESWKFQRAKAQSFIMNPDFKTFNARISRDKVENVLLPFLANACFQGLTLDIQDIFLRFTFDISTNFVLGTDLGSLSPDLPVSPMAKAMDDSTALINFRLIVPPVWWKLLKWLHVGREKMMSESCRTIDNFMYEIIETRKSEMASRKEPSSDFLSMCIADNEIAKSDKFIRDIIFNLLTAARDTTSSGMAWFFWLLSQNRHVEEKILRELSSLPRRLTSDGMVIFEPEELAKIVYLEAAILESLRLYPPVPFNMKKAKKPDVLPSGMTVTTDLKILICLYAMGRMETIWGKDCTEFKPERWISNSGNLRYEPSHKFIPFHTGSRKCLGNNISLMQTRTTMAAMIYNFRFEVVEGHVVEPRFSLILHMKNGLMMNVKKRASV